MAQQQIPMTQYPQQPYVAPAPKSKFLIPAIVIGAALVIFIAVALLFFGKESPVEAPAQQDAVTEMPQQIQQPESQLPSEENFTVSKFYFGSVVDENGTFIINNDRKYAPGQFIYVYVQPVGFQKIQEGDKYKVDVVVDSRVFDPEGKIVPYLSIANLSSATETPNGNLAFQQRMVLRPNATIGEYTVFLTVKDILAGKQFSIKSAFTLIGPQPADVGGV